MTRYFKRPVDSTLRPPAIETTVALPFATADRDRLRHWLDDQRWPQATMGLSMLEGYLTALIVWPISLSAGAWLPRIWGDYGWRVPPVIEDVSSFDDFVSLITAYLQRLDRDLTAEPSTFTPTLCPDSRLLGRPVAPAVAWSAGFRAALALAHAGQSVLPSARRAAEAIARLPAGRPEQAESDDLQTLRNAAQVLAAQRISRGPLGPLPTWFKGARRGVEINQSIRK